jgi:RNA polymerase sigma-70 factor (ECF subfamily)
VPAIDSGRSAADREWFECTVVALLSDLFGTALRLTRNRADAEDLVADTVARGWTHLDELADRTRLRGWLFRILTNMFLSARRTDARRGVHESLDDETEDGFSLFEQLHVPILLFWGTPEQAFLDKLLREDLTRAVDALEDEYLALVDTAGLDCVERLGRLDYFSASTSAETRSIARSFNACSMVARAMKPPVSRLPSPFTWPPASATIHPAGESHVAATLAPLADAVLDGYGQLCGPLEPAMRAAMRALASGRVLEVRADDPAARLGVPAWSRLAGHTLLATIEEDDRRTRFFLRKR